MHYNEQFTQCVNNSSSQNVLYELDIRFCSIWHELRIGMTSSVRVWRHKSIFSGQNLRKCSILSNLHCVCINSYSSPNVFYGLDTFCSIWHGLCIGVTSSLRQWRHKLIYWLLSPISEEMIYIETSRQLVSSNSSQNALLGAWTHDLCVFNLAWFTSRCDVINTGMTA